MTISVKTEKMLWGRSANRCAICRCELIFDASETDDESVIGDACHMIGEKPTGPRGVSPLTLEKRNKYANLILLCKVHHKLIDDQPNTYTVEKLKDLKVNHEKWVRESLQEFDTAKQQDDETYAGYIDEWARVVDLDNWHVWSSFMLGPQPYMSRKRVKDLEDLRRWILSRVWPKRYNELEAAIVNFRFVLDDFIETFRNHATSSHEDKVLITEKFYHLTDWDPPRYHRLLQTYYFHVDLVHDLMLELSRAANYVCDKVRHDILPTFRIEEGIVLADSGPYGFLNYITHRVEYLENERTLYPYPGLEKFKLTRKTRDYHFGEGINFEDPFYGAEKADNPL